MEVLKCFICRNIIKGGLNGLARHFTIVHGFMLNCGIEKSVFQCGQDNCYQRFFHFYSLRDHIRKVHFPQEENFNSIENTESFSLHNNIIINENENTGSVSLDNNIIINENDENKISTLSGNPDNVEILNFCDNFNLKDSLINLIIRLQSKASMTGSTVTDILDEFEQIVNNLCLSLKIKVEKFLQSKELLNDSGVSDLLNSFETNKSFEGLKTLEQQMEALTNSTKYIQP